MICIYVFILNLYTCAQSDELYDRSRNRATCMILVHGGPHQREQTENLVSRNLIFATFDTLVR